MNWQTAAVMAPIVLSGIGLATLACLGVEGLKSHPVAASFGVAVCIFALICGLAGPWWAIGSAIAAVAFVVWRSL